MTISDVERSVPVECYAVAADEHSLAENSLVRMSFQAEVEFSLMKYDLSIGLFEFLLLCSIIEFIRSLLPLSDFEFHRN